MENVIYPVDNLLKQLRQTENVQNVKSYEQFSTHYAQAAKSDFFWPETIFHISTLTTTTTTNYLKLI